MMKTTKTYKKTSNQSRQFKQQIEHTSLCELTLDDEKYNNLKSTNVVYEDKSLVSDENQVKGVKTQKFKTFIKEHIFEEVVSVIISLLLLVGGWIIHNIIDFKVQFATVSVEIENMEEEINDLNDEVVTKDFLQSQISELKNDLLTADSEKINDIKIKVELLEKEIDYLSQ